MATMVVPYRDVNAQNKQYMMMLAQLLGERGQEATQQDRMAALAESLVPQPTSTINDQQLFSDQGFDALRGNVLEGTPAAFGQVPGQPLNQMQIRQKALSSGLPIQDAMSVVRGMPQTQQQGFTLGPGQTRFGPQGQQIAKGSPKAKEPKVYDIKTIERYLFDITTDKKTNEPRKPTKTEIFTVKEMARNSGYKVRKITLREAKKKKLFGIDRLWPDQKEKTQWVLEKDGEIIPPTPATSQQDSLLTFKAVNPNTGERVITYDGGKTWQPVQ